MSFLWMSIHHLQVAKLSRCPLGSRIPPFLTLRGFVWVNARNKPRAELREFPQYLSFSVYICFETHKVFFGERDIVRTSENPYYLSLPTLIFFCLWIQ